LLDAPASRPSATYEEACERARAIMARDDDRVLPEGRTALTTGGARARLAVVLFHGFTNHPGQYAQFASLLAARGVNVFVPRMWGHGYRDRMSRDLERFDMAKGLIGAYEALDAACGLGDRVAVSGISLGGVLSAHIAQHRPDVTLSVPVAPDIAILNFPYVVSRGAGMAMRFLPNRFQWWDPRVKEAQRPATAYPQFSTRALGQTLLLSDAVYGAARASAPSAARITTISNRRDPAVNHNVTEKVVSLWTERRGDGTVSLVDIDGLPANHDIVDPDNPLARTDLVYPVLVEALLAGEVGPA